MKLPHRATRRPGNPDTGHVATKAREAIRQSRRDRINGSGGEGDDRNFLSCLVGGKRSPLPIDFGKNAGVNCQSRVRKRLSGHQCQTKSPTTYGRNTCWAER